MEQFVSMRGGHYVAYKGGEERHFLGVSTRVVSNTRERAPRGVSTRETSNARGSAPREVSTREASTNHVCM